MKSGGETINIDTDRYPDVRFVPERIVTIKVAFDGDIDENSILTLRSGSSAWSAEGLAGEVDTDGTQLYIFEDIDLAEIDTGQSGFVAASRNVFTAIVEIDPDDSITDLTLSIESNTVQLNQDNLADLRFVSVENKPAFHLEVFSRSMYRSRWNRIEFHQFDSFMNHDFRLVAKIENAHNQDLTFSDFDMLFEVELESGEKIRRIIPVLFEELKDGAQLQVKSATGGYGSPIMAGVGGGSFFPPYGSMQIPPGERPKHFRAKIDYLEGNPFGIVEELVESNNEIIHPFSPSYTPAGNEFIVPIPLGYTDPTRKALQDENHQIIGEEEIWDASNYSLTFRSHRKFGEYSPVRIRIFSKYPSHGFPGFQRIPREVELDVLTLEAGESLDWVVPPSHELASRDPDYRYHEFTSTAYSLAGQQSWPGLSAGIPHSQELWGRSLFIVSESLSGVEEWGAVSITLNNVTQKNSHFAQHLGASDLIVPMEQLDTTYTVTTHYPAQMDYVGSLSYLRSFAPATDYFPKRQLKFQYFMISSVFDGTEVTVVQNMLGVPPEEDFIGEYTEGGNSYTFELNRGQTYVWAPYSDAESDWDSIYQDPTGVSIVANKPVMVTGGLNGALPSIASRGSSHAFITMHPSGVRGTDFLVPPAPHGLDHVYGFGKRYSNSFFRVIPTATDGGATEVRLNQNEKVFSLNDGQYLEITPLNPFLQFSDDVPVLKSKYSDRLREVVPGTTSAQPEFKYVQRHEIDGNDLRHIGSDRPVQVTQYFISRMNRTPIFDTSCLTCHYTHSHSTNEFDHLYTPFDPEYTIGTKTPGNAEFVSIIPRRAYNIDTVIPVSLPGDGFMKSNAGNLEHTSNQNSLPIHFVTIMIAYDENSSAGYDIPSISYKRKHEPIHRLVSADREDHSVVKYPRRYEPLSDEEAADYTNNDMLMYDYGLQDMPSDVWFHGNKIFRVLEAPGWREVRWGDSRYKYITLKLHVRSDEERHLEFWNPDNVPLSIISSGIKLGVGRGAGGSDGATYATQNTYRYTELEELYPPEGVDLALFDTSIRFPYNLGKLRPGELVPFVVEVSNLGTEISQMNVSVLARPSPVSGWIYAGNRGFMRDLL
ncbi:MAG: IgGFc-binding protein [Candidatus Sumerlaeia bacterium]|nr:IgGFc-binding protein [Candidatus Sumerlaeia bacterium]